MAASLTSLSHNISSRCISFILWATLATVATSFKIDERVASASAGSGDDCTIGLFAWARQHGAKIAESIEIKDTSYGGRGLFAKTPIPANTELIQIPYHLQLGVRQLADGTDEEMQKMAQSLPWQFIMEHELFFVPLSVALIAEKRKVASGSSIFGPFIDSLPHYCANAAGTLLDGRGDGLHDLLHWAPHLGNKVQRWRTGIQSLHESVAPPSVALEEFRWAATNVCSRSLVRKRIQELSSDQVKRIGEFSASDHSRMLPIIDLVNHGSLQHANVWVGHLSRGDDSGSGDEEINDFSTSLKSTRDIAAGEELLFDYGGGGGEKVSNDRLLLDYGFVLAGHTDRASVSLEEFDAAISANDNDRAGMNDVPQKDIEGLHALITFSIKQASKLQAGAPLLFNAQGEPTGPTLAVAVAMTCRGLEDVTRVLQPVHQAATAKDLDASMLLSQIVESCTELQRQYARYVLKIAAGLALSVLSGRPPISDADDKNEGSCDAEDGKAKAGFENVARDYSKMCRKLLEEVADMSR